MRIVGGRYRGKQLAAPDGLNTRPTTDRAREGLFNILENGVPGFRLPGASVADLFAGSGALGLEALSRGADSLVLVENDRTALAVIRQNVGSLKPEDSTKVKVMKTDAASLPASTSPLDLILMDPPYHSGLAGPVISKLATTGWAGPETVIVVELAKDEDEPDIDGFELLKSRAYGIARFDIFRRSGAQAA